MSEPYMAINTFSQLFTVIFQSNRLFLWTIHVWNIHVRTFYFAGGNHRWCHC
jgi:hypothetical protein